MNENVLNQNDASVLAINLLFICSSGYLFPDPSFFSGGLIFFYSCRPLCSLV